MVCLLLILSTRATRTIIKSIQETKNEKLSFILATLLSITAFSVHADVDTAKKLADKYALIAKNIDPASKGLSEEDGKNFFNRINRADIFPV